MKPLNKTEIKQNLKNNVEVKIFDQVSSTSDYAKDFTKQNDVKVPHIFISEQQTGGHGLHQRPFFSPKGTGLYISILLPNFKVDPQKEGLITTGTVVVVINSLLEFYPQTDFKIKWVNDVLLNHKKIGGILTEVVQNDLIVGIGLNLNTVNFPKELKAKVGDINSEKPIDRNLLAAKITDEFLTMMHDYQSGSFLLEYSDKLDTLNHQVVIKLGNRTVTGIARGVDQNGALVIKEKNGKIKTISTGEVVKVTSPDNTYKG